MPTVLDAFDGLLDVPGVFVLGSNDYFAPSLRNPLRYLLPDDGRRNVHTAEAAVRETAGRVRGAGGGWISATAVAG